MTYTQEGRIIKVTGGLYTVRLNHTPASPTPLDGLAAGCRARGQFRHARLTPLVGDLVTVQYEDRSVIRENGTVRPNEDGTGLLITGILPRRNALIRPPLCNLDVMLTVMAASSPEADLLTVDKQLAIMEHQGIESAVVIGKCELNPEKARLLQDIYTKAGYAVFPVSCRTGEGIGALKAYLSGILTGKIAALAGASGVGKSTLLNTLFPFLHLETGAVSERIERGKNTTRHTELFAIPTDGGEGYIADTAGFSLLDFENFHFFDLEDLPAAFREIAPLTSECRYTDCTHVSDEGCAVLQALHDGKIAPSRHASYCELYAVLKARKTYS